MEITPKDFARRAEISPSYAWEILNGKRKPSRSLALRIFDSTGLRFGPLHDLTDADIEVVRKMERAQ